MVVPANRVEVTEGFIPDFWAVYVIEDPVLGYFAGWKPFWEHPRVPLWCKTLFGAEKFDAHRSLISREKAIGIRNKISPDGKVWAYVRHEIFPEEYPTYEKTRTS